MDIVNFLGRFHPLLLHLPIGFVLLAFGMELRDRWRGGTDFSAAIRFSLFWGAVGSVAAAVTGYMLAQQGGYEEQTLGRHQWLGIAVAALAVGMYVLHARRDRATVQRLYFPAFVATVLALSITGHLGGSLTHGSDFISPGHLYPEERARVANLRSAVVFADFIQPILNDKCVRCHGATKQKGELVLHTAAGILAGGENGPVVVAGDVAKSPLVQRIHLPLEDEEHMPPKDKAQLTEQEIRLLEWWIEGGAEMKATVAESEVPEEVRAILEAYVEPADGVFALNVSPASGRRLNRLRAAGIDFTRLHAESPFLAVDLSRRDSLGAATLDELDAVASQLIDLDLSYTNVSDADLEVLRKLPNLRELSLQHTAITDATLGRLRGHDYLERLNVYGTAVTDTGLAVLAALPRLRKLYLWRTAVTEDGLAELRRAQPKLYVDTGAGTELFGDARLKAPIIQAATDIFSDSMEVALVLNMTGVEIYYTLDGTPPDSSSARYHAPFYLRESSKVQAIAVKAGWQPSPVAERQLVRMRYPARAVALAPRPDDRYPGDGSKTLIDFQKGSTVFSDGRWLGYEQSHVTATLDLGANQEISGVSVGALEATASYIFFPRGMEVALSNDGRTFEKVATATYPVTAGPEPPRTANFTERFPTRRARYVRVKVLSTMRNPEWHTAPGAPCWVFLDEVLVE